LQIEVLFAGASQPFNLRRVYDGPEFRPVNTAHFRKSWEKIAIKIASGKDIATSTVLRELFIGQYKTDMSKDNPPAPGPESTSGGERQRHALRHAAPRASRWQARARRNSDTCAADKRKRSAADRLEGAAIGTRPGAALRHAHGKSAALDNPERKIIKLSVTQNALVRLETGGG
jgi:hypothetical protein